jgi:hypothetical protein
MLHLFGQLTLFKKGKTCLILEVYDKWFLNHTNICSIFISRWQKMKPSDKMKNKAKNETVFGTVPKCNSKNGGKNIYL